MELMALPITFGSGVHKQSGFTYLAILMAIAVMGILLAAVGNVWSTRMQREREQELLFIGAEIRHAIARYYFNPAAGAHAFPMTLEDLVEDRRSAVPQHHLRKLYKDPMTGAADWQFVRSAEGGIIGVYSSSHLHPIKKANFKTIDASFADAECYCDWKFVYTIRSRYTPQVAPR
jgi:type II secretory pathway pseudopilin PulG